MLKAPQGDVGEDLLTKLEDYKPKQSSLNVPLMPFNGLQLYDEMDVSLSVKITISDYEYRILARKVKPNTIKTVSGSLRFEELIDPIPLSLDEDVSIQVVEVFYKLKNCEVFVRCDLTNKALSSHRRRNEKVKPANDLILKLQDLGFTIFKSDKYGDLFEEE